MLEHEHAQLISDLIKTEKYLTKYSRLIFFLKLNLGLIDGVKHSQKSISQMHNISSSRTSQIIIRAKRLVVTSYYKYHADILKDISLILIDFKKLAELNNARLNNYDK